MNGEIFFLLGEIIGSFFTFGPIKLLISRLGFKEPKHLLKVFIFLTFCIVFALVDIFDLFYKNQLSPFELASNLLRFSAILISFFLWVILDEKKYQDPISCKIFIFSRRALASLIDHLLLIVLFISFKYFLGELNFWKFISFAIIYFSVFEVYGKTLGKFLMQINIEIDKTLKGLFLSIQRNTLKYLIPLFGCIFFNNYILVVFGFAGMINLFTMFLFNKRFRTWYDFNIQIKKASVEVSI
jgi:hypothetical protein